jgi:hypothetical protein
MRLMQSSGATVAFKECPPGLVKFLLPALQSGKKMLTFRITVSCRLQAGVDASRGREVGVCWLQMSTKIKEHRGKAVLTVRRFCR